MEKQLFKDYEPEDRERMLSDNCDSVVENYQFTKHLTAEELDVYREKFADNSIQLKNIEQEAKDFSDLKKAESKPFKLEVENLRNAIKRKAIDTEGVAYLFPDYENNEMAYYDNVGDLISTRRLRPEEKQLNIHSLRKAN